MIETNIPRASTALLRPNHRGKGAVLSYFLLVCSIVALISLVSHHSEDLAPIETLDSESTLDKSIVNTEAATHHSDLRSQIMSSIASMESDFQMKVAGLEREIHELPSSRSPSTEEHPSLSSDLSDMSAPNSLESKTQMILKANSQLLKQMFLSCLSQHSKDSLAPASLAGDKILQLCQSKIYGGLEQGAAMFSNEPSRSRGSPSKASSFFKSDQSPKASVSAPLSPKQGQISKPSVAKKVVKSQTSLQSLHWPESNNVQGYLKSLSPPGVSPRKMQTLAEHHQYASNDVSGKFESYHYHPIGYHDPEHHNLSHFMRSNIIRHNLPISANPFYYYRRHDYSGERLQSAGVRVDRFPLFDHHSQRRFQWGADGRNHYNFTAHEQPPYSYEYARRPYWAYMNHALRSQPAFRNPEGQHNLRLMLGTLVPQIGDYFLNASRRQVPHNPPGYRDHFGHWKPHSIMNHRLLYGGSSLFNGIIPQHYVTPTPLGRMLNPHGLAARPGEYGAHDPFSPYDPYGRFAFGGHSPTGGAKGPGGPGRHINYTHPLGSGPELAGKPEDDIPGPLPYDGSASPLPENVTMPVLVQAHKDTWGLFDTTINVSSGLLNKRSRDLDIPVSDGHLIPRGSDNCNMPTDVLDLPGLLDEVVVPRQNHMEPMVVNSLLRHALEPRHLVSRGQAKLEKAGVNVDGFRTK